MTTQAPIESDARRSETRSLEHAQDDDPQRHEPCEPLGPLYAGIAVGALAVAGATAVGLRWASRPAAPKTITMGPGGWVSFKGLKPPPVGPRRPWWAVLLRAQRCT
jgi:hypothetical protein